MFEVLGDTARDYFFLIFTQPLLNELATTSSPNLFICSAYFISFNNLLLARLLFLGDQIHRKVKNLPSVTVFDLI